MVTDVSPTPPHFLETPMLLRRTLKNFDNMRTLWALDDARRLHWQGRLNEAIAILMYLDSTVINEPSFDSEEYRNGERKSETPDDEQEEPEGGRSFDEDIEVTRDDDGYLIR